MKKQIDDIVCAMVALAKALPGVNHVNVARFSDRVDVRFSVATLDDFERYANATGGAISTVGINGSEWEIAVSAVGLIASLEISGPHRAQRKPAEGQPSIDDGEAFAALKQAARALP